jgi:hypothetical protein
VLGRGTPLTICASRAQIGEDCEYAAVVVFRLLDAQLLQDLPNVCLEGLRADKELLRDRVVRATLGHKGQHLALSTSETRSLRRYPTWLGASAMRRIA